MEDKFYILNEFGNRLSKLDKEKKDRFYVILQGLSHYFCKKYKVTVKVFNEDKANYLFAIAFEQGQSNLLQNIMKALEEFEKPLDDDIRKLFKRVLVVAKKLKQLSIDTDNYDNCRFLITTMCLYYKNYVGNSVDCSEHLYMVFPAIMGSLVGKEKTTIINAFLEEIEELLLK
jgi:hypothetical protein